MVRRAVSCDESLLRSFLDDDLAELEQAELADHLGTCTSCRRMLERLAAGTRLWAELRQLPRWGRIRASFRADGGVYGPPRSKIAERGRLGTRPVARFSRCFGNSGVARPIRNLRDHTIARPRRLWDRA